MRQRRRSYSYLFIALGSVCIDGRTEFDLTCFAFRCPPSARKHLKRTNLACKLEVLNQVLFSTRQLKNGLDREGEETQLANCSKRLFGS